jgi:hypothetical protein
MFTRFITASALSVTLAFSSAAFAASTNFIDNGSYTTDTISGLDWLDVSTSKNQSYNYVSGQFGVGGVYQGYRYATRTEFSNLISGFTGIDYAWYGLAGHHDVPTGTLTKINNLLGPTWTFGIIGMYALDPNHPYTWLTGLMANTYVRFQPASPRSGTPARYYAHITTSSSSAVGFGDQQDPTRGSWLVRDTLNPVPIPAAAFMFAPALLGFLGLRRKAKNLAA